LPIGERLPAQNLNTELAASLVLRRAAIASRSRTISASSSPIRSASDAQGDRRLAGRQHIAELRADRRLLHLHPLEVQGVADGDVAGGIMGVNPIQNGQLTREEIERAEADPNIPHEDVGPQGPRAAAKRKGPRYTPISRRNERPNAIKWLLRNHPELKDAQIMRLVGTTKSTIDSVREGTHWNNANIAPMDPVTLGLCSQIDLDLEVKRASKGTASPDEADTGTMLLTAEEALAAEDAAQRGRRRELISPGPRQTAARARASTAVPSAAVLTLTSWHRRNGSRSRPPPA
jgi:hypothetical protein